MDDSNYKWALYFYKLVFLKFSGKPLSIKPLHIFVTLVYIICMVLAILQMLWGNLHVVKLAALISGLVTWAQCLVSLIIRFVYDKDFEDLLDSRDHFWLPVSLDDETEGRIRFWLKFCRIARTSVVGSLFCLLGALLLKAIVFFQLPMDSWIPNTWFLNLRTLMFMQMFNSVFTIILISGVNCILLAFLVDLIIQFIVLNYHLRNTEDFSEVFLRKCVEHHLILYSFGQRLSKVFSMYYLSKFISSTVLICTNLYILTDRTPDIPFSSKMVSLFYSIYIPAQLFSICFPAAYVTYEAFDTSKAVYFSKWYDSLGRANCKFYLLFMIQKAQSPLAFSIGGMGDVSMNTLTTVYQSCGSFITMLRSLED